MQGNSCPRHGSRCRQSSAEGVSIVSDGWTDIKSKPLINVIASNSRGSCFLYAEDYSGVEKTGEAIAQFLLKAIDEIGPENVLQVVTDNASNCKAAGREVQKRLTACREALSTTVVTKQWKDWVKGCSSDKGPRFYDKKYLETLAPGGTVRKAPNEDEEVMTVIE
ncbi:hypothetical protein U9M48_039364 [Paspalum notatum var. saurae]|uniref:DUF659 domain-containing protein n=1 Tax=Paspalum notatum var. saurae TaxID=547442 RepID=A0AAQ3XBC4_PASNO